MSFFTTARERLIAQGAIKPAPHDPEPMTFEQWLAEGWRNAKGSIDDLNAKAGFASVKPDRYPTERIKCSLNDLSINERKQSLMRKRVVFDLPPQEFHEKFLAEGVHLRLAKDE